MLLSHVFIPITDFDRAFAFYSALMTSLALKLRFVERGDQQWCGWQSAGAARPLFLIGTPFDGQPAAAGNGNMVALMAADRAMVDRVHAVALASGGRCEGPPGLRPRYHAHYYGGYFRDPDGNKQRSNCIFSAAPLL